MSSPYLRPSPPWDTVRAENPGKRMARFMDLVDRSQSFLVLADNEKIPDGAQILYPITTPLTSDEFVRTIAEFDELWLAEREQAPVE